MTGTKEIHVLIRPDGSTKVDVQGACGSECASLTKGIEQALGTVTSDVKKPEYLQTATQTQTARR